MNDPRPLDAAEPDAVASPRSWLRRHTLALVVSLVVAAAFVWLLERGALPVWPDAEALELAEWWVVPSYVIGFTVVLTLRAVRWYWLLAPVHRLSMSRILSVSFVFYGALILLPFRMGEAVRPALIRQKDKLSAWAATGTVAAERVIDGLFSSVILFVALGAAQHLEPLPEKIGKLPVSAKLVPGAAYTMVAVFACALATIAVFYWSHGWARRITERWVGFVSPKAAVWITDKIDHLADGLRFMPRLRYSLPFLALTAGYWLSNAVALWLLMRGSGLTEATFAQACVVLGVLSVGLLIPSAPGFFGTFQLSVYAGLAMYYSESTIVGAGSVVVFYMYSIQVALSLGYALLALSLEWLRGRRNAASASVA